MTNMLKRFFSCCALVALAACGGGSDDGLPSPLAPFAGLWSESCTATSAEARTLSLTRLSGNTLSGQLTISDCASTPIPVVLEVSISYDGTKPVDGGTAIKVTMIIPANPVIPWTIKKDLLLIKDGQLFLGDEQSIGTDGFPDLLDFARPLSRL